VDRWRLLLCALLAVPGSNVSVAFAAHSISAGHIGLLIATEPILIILFGAWLKKHRVHRRIVVGGAIAWSWYTVLVASLTRRYGALAVTGGVRQRAAVMPARLTDCEHRPGV